MDDRVQDSIGLLWKKPKAWPFREMSTQYDLWPTSERVEFEMAGAIVHRK